jgi:hypothetical protein
MVKGVSLINRGEGFVFICLRNQKYTSLRKYKYKKMLDYNIIGDVSEPVMDNNDGQLNTEYELNKMYTTLNVAYTHLNETHRKFLRISICLFQLSGKVNWRDVINVMGVSERRGRKILNNVRNWLRTIIDKDNHNELQKLCDVGELYRILQNL